MTNQFDRLKTLAKERYNEDGGTMYECYDEQDYHNDIEEYGTADAAWSAHIEIHGVER